VERGVQVERAFTMKKARLVYGLLSPIVLIAGVCVYALFRTPGSLLITAWLPHLYSFDSALVPLPPSPFSHVLKYNIAGMFWLVSGILFFRFVWFGNVKTQRLYITLLCTMAAAFEISQLSGRFAGTFDPLDLLFMGIGVSIEAALYTVFVKRKAA
jgi:hypothetical protein